MLNWRAQLTDPAQQNPPRQILAGSYKDAAHWADEVLKAAGPRAFVTIYETTERCVATLPRDPRPTTAPIIDLTK
jgi:hypothetical protein